MKRLSLGVLSVTVITGVCLAQVVAFDDLFPRAAQQTMGLHKLSDEERDALRGHVQALLAAVLTSRAQSTVSPSSSPRERGRDLTYLGVGGDHWVRKNVDQGRFIVLEDNSLWAVDPLNRVDAMLWLPISDITVLESATGSPGYNYLLINTDDGEQAHAKYLGRQ